MVSSGSSKQSLLISAVATNVTLSSLMFRCRHYWFLEFCILEEWCPVDYPFKLCTEVEIGDLGQALSTRPDILSTVYCEELAKLQDQIPPFPTHVAIKTIESQLGAPVSTIFADISTEPIAAASLGQVYKAHLHSGELVAVKVQRPGMSLSLTLDALLFHMIGGQLKRFAKARKDLLVAVNEMVRRMFEEIDYVLEGQNAESPGFATFGLYHAETLALVLRPLFFAIFGLATSGLCNFTPKPTPITTPTLSLFLMTSGLRNCCGEHRFFASPCN
ncbi:hypothetical protein U1Q18_002906 [Sarracenia purpurea var. burkii]